MSIVTVNQAATHLRIELPESDTDPVTLELVALLAGAESLVLDHIEKSEDELPDPLPFAIQAAVLLVLTALYDERDQDPMTPAVQSLLYPYRSTGIF